DAGRRRDLLDRQLAFLLQEEGFALRLGKRRERRQQALRRALAVQPQFRRDLPRREVLERGLALFVIEERSPPVRAEEIHQPVVGNGVYPGGEFRPDLVAPAGVDDAHPGVLEQFLRGSGIARLPQQEPVQGEAVAAVERLEGADIAFAVAQHQLLVGRLANHAAQVYRFAGPAVRRGNRLGSRNGQGRSEFGHTEVNGGITGSGLTVPNQILPCARGWRFFSDETS